MDREISLVFQRHLLNPLYCGPGRWIISNARSKKHYLLTGKDTVNLNISKINEVVSEFHKVGNISSCEIFKRFYGRYVMDFPFEDYYNPEWKENDLITMKAYAKISEIPPKSLKFDYKDVLNCNGDNTEILESLYKLLQYTFGIQRIVHDCEFGPWFRKTSPSGGSIHPSECFVYMPDNLQPLSSGIYYYNFTTNQLQLLHVKDIPPTINSFNSKSLTVFCFLDLKRVQFRYRTPRSWRPALIDTGHILYSLQLSAKSIGLDIYPYIPMQTDSKKASSLDLPLIFAAEVGNKSNDIDISQINDSMKFEDEFFTNPFVFLFKSENNWFAATIYPNESIVKINNAQLQILTHLQYSRRGDRQRNTKYLLEIFDISKNELNILKNNHLLVTESEGLFWTSVINPSCHKGWYLSLLENIASKEKDRINIKEIVLNKTEADFLYNMGLKRKTCRSFRNVKIDTRLFDSLKEDFAKLIRENAEWNELEVYCFEMTNENTPIYRISIEGITRMMKQINRSIIRKIAIGQKWSCDASVGLYVISTQKEAQSLKFNCLKLGQFAQAVILNALKYNLESFMTPALKDIELQSILYKDIQPSRIPYFIEIGYEK